MRSGHRVEGLISGLGRISVVAGNSSTVGWISGIRAAAATPPPTSCCLATSGLIFSCTNPRVPSASGPVRSRSRSASRGGRLCAASASTASPAICWTSTRAMTSAVMRLASGRLHGRSAATGLTVATNRSVFDTWLFVQTASRAPAGSPSRLKPNARVAAPAAEVGRRAARPLPRVAAPVRPARRPSSRRSRRARRRLPSHAGGVPHCPAFGHLVLVSERRAQTRFLLGRQVRRHQVRACLAELPDHAVRHSVDAHHEQR